MRSTAKHMIPVLTLLLVVGATAAVAAGEGEVQTSPAVPPSDPAGDSQSGAGSGDGGGMGDPDPGSVCDVQFGGVSGGGHVAFQAWVDCVDSGTPETYSFEPQYAGNDFVGLHVERLDGLDLDALCFRETMPLMNSVRVTVATPGLAARISKVAVSNFNGGTTTIVLNGQVFTFQSRASLDPTVLDAQIFDTLEQFGYAIIDTGNYWVISADPFFNTITDVQFSSTDTAIVNSAVSLEPPNGDDWPYCFVQDNWPE